MRAAAATLAALIACGIAASAPSPAAAQDRALIPVQFRRAQLSDIVDQLGPSLGERIIYDQSLTGQVTIAVPRPVSKSEAWQILHAALAMKGFAALPIGPGGFKIVPLSIAGDSDPWTLAAPSPVGESRILTLIPLREVAVADVLSVIRPLLDATTIAIPSPSTNSLIIATTERRVAAIASLLRGLDVRDASEPRFRPLRERDAMMALDVVEARYAPEEAGRHGVTAWVDARTNTLIYRAPPARQLEIDAMLVDLDQRDESAGEIHVIRLGHAEAQSVAEHLHNLAANASGVPGQASPLAGSGLNVVADPGTQSLIVNAPPEILELVREVVAQLDRPPKQVAVDVLVQEWAYDASFDLSLIGTTAIATQGSEVGFVEGIGLSSQSIAGGFRPESVVDDFKVLARNGVHQIQLLANQSEVDSVTLLRPHLILLSGEEQSIFQGNNVPIPVAPSDAGPESVLRQETTIERHDVGIDLRLRATVGDSSAARIEVSLDIENLRSSLTGQAGEVGPTFTQRNVQTTVEVLPGQALLIGGSTQGFVERTRTGIPFIMNIPFIGRIFSATSENDRRGRIVVAIQAEALPDVDSLVEYSIRRRTAFERSAAISDALETDAESGFAIRIGSETARHAAEAIADEHGTEQYPSHVIAWSGRTGDFFDVHLTGFADYLEAADAAYRLNASGVRSDVLPLGSATATLH